MARPPATGWHLPSTRHPDPFAADTADTAGTDGARTSGSNGRKRACVCPPRGLAPVRALAHVLVRARPSGHVRAHRSLAAGALWQHTMPDRPRGVVSIQADSKTYRRGLRLAEGSATPVARLGRPRERTPPGRADGAPIGI